MDIKTTWERTWQWVVGLALVSYMLWQTYTGDGWVFPFSYADLGFHELGHMLTMFWAPQPLVAFAGSAMQVLVPLGLAGYFALRRKDLFATALMLAWAGTSLHNVSVYIYDATRRVLPLLGGQEGHDWAYLLGPQVLNSLPATDSIALFTKAFSVLLFVAALGVVVYGFAKPRVSSRQAEQMEEYQSTLPVREPRARVSSAAGDSAASVAPPSGQGFPAE